MVSKSKKPEAPPVLDWKTGPSFYVSVMDAGRTALVLGPFRLEADCREWAYRDLALGGSADKCNWLRAEAESHDPWSAFYSWGMVKVETGSKTGSLNRYVYELDWDGSASVDLPPSVEVSPVKPKRGQKRPLKIAHYSHRAEDKPYDQIVERASVEPKKRSKRRG